MVQSIVTLEVYTDSWILPFQMLNEGTNVLFAVRIVVPDLCLAVIFLTVWEMWMLVKEKGENCPHTSSVPPPGVK